MKYFTLLFAFAILACKKDSESIFQTGTGTVTAELIWKEKIADQPIWLFSSKTLTDDGGAIYTRLFAGPENTVVCRDLETGAIRFEWEAPQDISDGEFISFLESYHNNLIIHSENEINVIDTKTSGSIWRLDVQDSGGSGLNRMTMIDDTLYTMHSSDGREEASVVKTSVNTGKFDTLISFSAQDYGPGTRFLAYSFAKWYDPLISKDLLLFERPRGANGQKSKVDLVALNLATRQVEWKIEDFEPNGYSAAQAPILIHGDKAFVLGAITLFCVDLTERKIIWTKKYNERTPDFISEHLQYTKPVIVNNLLIIKPLSERCFAYDVNTGNEVWRNGEGARDAIDIEEYKGYLFMASNSEGNIWVHRVSDGKFITRLKSPHSSWIIDEICIDKNKGLLFCTDDYYAMCFKLKVE
jgi:outer membrane protein assembly factor BamB